MRLDDIAYIRLFSQQITASKFKKVKDLVGWMGAIQAQDFAMSKWAIGVRLPNSTDKTVSSAIDKGEIFRTHLMRPTWHLVSSEDIYWMIELTADKLKASMKSRHKSMGLTEAVFRKTRHIMEKALRDETHLTRDELICMFEAAGIPTNNNRASHIFFHAEFNGLICSGKSKNGKPTYALLEERAAKTKPLKREEASARLAQKYFTSHCPATLYDFTWWSGLSVSEAKCAIEIVKANFISETTNSKIYFMPNNFSLPNTAKKEVFLLPAFDEFIISYKDRGASLTFKNHIKAVSNNGMFSPIIVENGKVIGTWGRTIKKDKAIMNTNFFGAPGETTIGEIKKESQRFGAFLGKEVEFNQ